MSKYQEYHLPCALFFVCYCRLPFDSQDPTLFVLTTIFLNYASVPTITAMTSTDALFSGVCLYMDGQFQAIRLELEALAETVDKYTLKSSAAETRRINLELRRINKRHQTIIDVVSEVRHAFTPTILIMHICAAFMICVISMAMFLVSAELTGKPNVSCFHLLFSLPPAGRRNQQAHLHAVHVYSADVAFYVLVQWHDCARFGTSCS